MPFARALPILVSLAASLASHDVQAQAGQPWVGPGIEAQGTGRAVRFTVRVENISAGEALKLSNGKSAPFVSAPVLWAIHTGSVNPIFAAGQRDAGEGLESLAESGNPSKLVATVAAKPDVVTAGAAARPVGSATDGPVTPGQKYEFEISVEPGQSLSAAWMFGQSNDLFYSNDRPVALFSADGKPISGELTMQLSLWDAGTEVNEEPGVGPSQGPRQPTPDTGVTESQAIAHVRDRYTYPRTGDVLRVTVAPAKDALSSR